MRGAVRLPGHGAAVSDVRAVIVDGYRRVRLRRGSLYLAGGRRSGTRIGVGGRFKAEGYAAHRKAGQLRVVGGVGCKVHCGSDSFIVDIDCHKCAWDNRHAIRALFALKDGVILDKLYLSAALNGHAAAQGQQVQVAVTANNVAVRDKLEHVHVAGNNRQCSVEVCHNVAAGRKGDELRAQLRVSFRIHCPKHLSAAVAGVGVADCLHQFGPKLCAGGGGAVNLDDVGGAQVLPCRGVCRIIGRLRGLRQSGDNTERHLACCALAIQDRFVHRKAYRLGQHLDNPACQINVVVLKDGVAHRDKARYLVTVQGDLIKHKAQFIDCAAHLSPYRFRYSARNGLSCLTAHITHSDAVKQFGVAVHIFGNQVEHDHRDSQLCATNGSLLALHAAQIAQKLLHGVISKDRLSLLAAQRVKYSLALWQRANVCNVHLVSFPSFVVFGFRAFSRIVASGWGVCLDFLNLSLDFADFLFDRVFPLIVGLFFGLKPIYILGNHLFFFFGCRLVYRLFKFRLTGCKLRILFAQGFQLFIEPVHFASQHQDFQCHYFSPRSLLSISSRHFARFASFACSSLCFACSNSSFALAWIEVWA